MLAKTDFITYKEIYQQPELWSKVFQIVYSQKDDLKRFIDKFRKNDGGEVIFTGAGSSFFVGEIVAGIFQKNTGFSSKAVSTTEIVTHPGHYINPAKQTLMISFARSGNSPESIGAIKHADLISDKILHLIITCNKDGKLVKMLNGNPRYVLTMPEEANDKGLAMTSSVTSMALSVLLISHLDNLDEQENKVLQAAKYARYILSEYTSVLRKVAKLDFNRAVFLGSGPFMGVAREAHLKLQEMTDGRVICKFDSFLSFRHGPKAVLNEKTLLVYFFSNNKYVKKYESDLVLSVAKNHKLLGVVSVSETFQKEKVSDYEIVMTSEEKMLDESYLTLCSLIPAQLLAYYKSLIVGLNPDNPSSGAIHRVVQGVTIYDYVNE